MSTAAKKRAATRKTKKAPPPAPNEREAPAAAEKPEPESRLHKLLTGPRYLVGLALTAIVPVVALGGYNHFRDHADNAIGTDFNVVVEYDPEAGSDYSRVVPASVPPDQVHQLLSKSSFFDSGMLSSIKVGEQGIKLTVGGQRTDRVKITGMRAVVLKRDPITAGTLFHYGAEGEPTVQLGFDLAAPTATARNARTDGRLGDPYFRSTGEPLSTGDSTTFEIVAYPGAHTYTWEIEISLYVEGKAETRRISGPDGPFQVTGYSRTYQAAYDMTGPDANDNLWTPMSQGRVCQLSKTNC